MKKKFRVAMPLVLLLMFVSVSYAGIMNRNVETDANIDSSKINLTAVAVTGGSINGTTIGATSASTGAFTTLSASGAITFSSGVSFNDTNITNVQYIYLDGIGADDASSFSFLNNWTAAGRTCADAGILTTVDINGGSGDAFAIGAASPSTGAFTTLTSTGGGINGTVGAITPSTGVFTGLNVSGTGIANSVTFNDTDITNVQGIYLDTIYADNATSFSMGNNWTNAGRTVADAGILTTVDINGGTADALTIGGSTPGAGTFTTLTTTGKLTVLEMALTQVNKDTDYTILTTDSGKIFTNIGAGAGITLTLPTPYAGARVEVAKVDAQNILVSSGNTILGTTNNAYRTSTAGSSLTLAGVSATQWAVMSTVGTWVDTTTAP